MVDNKVLDEFVSALKTDEKDKNSIHSAIVSKVDEEGVVWVYVAGSDKETPTASIATEVKKGDAVNVEWRNNKLYIVRNYTNPSAGTTRVIRAENNALDALNNANAAQAAASSAQASAETASTAAAEAVTDAATAKANAQTAIADAAAAASAASQAQTSAQSAQSSANGALKGLSTVQDVIGVLDWAKDNATYTLTSDTDIVPGKTYWTRSGSGTEADPYTYTPVVNPVKADLSAYYEISGVDEAMANYINTHLALTDEGLYVLGGANQWKVLIATDGVYIIDSTSGDDKVVARYGSTITLGEQNKQQINITSDSIRFGEYLNNLAYISEDKFYFLNGEILSSLFFKNFTLREGNDGKFIIGKR